MSTAESLDLEDEKQLPEGPHLRLLPPKGRSEEDLDATLKALENNRKHIAHVTGRNPERLRARAGERVSPKFYFSPGRHNHVKVAATPEEIDEHLD